MLYRPVEACVYVLRYDFMLCVMLEDHGRSPTQPIRHSEPSSDAGSAQTRLHRLTQISSSAIPTKFRQQTATLFPNNRGKFARLQSVKQSQPPSRPPSFHPRNSLFFFQTKKQKDNLLNTRTRPQPFALFAACEQAVELLGVGVDGCVDGRVLSSSSSPPPGLAEVAGSGLLLASVAAAPGRAGSGPVATEAQELAVLRAQVRCIVCVVTRACSKN